MLFCLWQEFEMESEAKSTASSPEDETFIPHISLTRNSM